ncbi:hypothetical protein ACFL6C_00635 [Myxococcota bacterium]
MVKRPRKLLKSIREQLANLEEVIAVGVTPPELTNFLQSMDQQLREFREASKSRRRVARKRRETGDHEQECDETQQHVAAGGQQRARAILGALLRPLPGSHLSARAPFRVTLWVLVALGALLLVRSDPTAEQSPLQASSPAHSSPVRLNKQMVADTLGNHGELPRSQPATDEPPHGAQHETPTPKIESPRAAVPKQTVATGVIAPTGEGPGDLDADTNETAHLDKQGTASPSAPSSDQGTGVTASGSGEAPVAASQSEELSGWVILYENGVRLLNQRKPLLAISEFEKAVALGPAEPNVHFALGVACQQLARQKCAARAFKKVLELAPAHEKAAEIRALLLANTKTNDVN